jgi:hypothetical protein
MKGERSEIQPSIITRNNKGCVNYTVALPFTLKSILRQKKELWKLKDFTMPKKNKP